MHLSKNREIVINPSHEPPPRLSCSSLQDIDISQENLRLIEVIFSQQTGDEDDPRAGDVARIRVIEDFNNQLQFIIEYNKKVLKNHHPFHYYYKELSRSILSQIIKYYKIASNAKKLDRSRSQVGTFVRTRIGNIFRDDW